MDTLAEDGVEETLRRLGFGYRAKYIANTAKMIKAMKDGESWLRGLRTLSYEEAHSSLLMLQGVGPKVADCVVSIICLYKQCRGSNGDDGNEVNTDGFCISRSA